MLDFQQNISEKKSPRDSFSESLFSIPYNESGLRPRESLQIAVTAKYQITNTLVSEIVDFG